MSGADFGRLQGDIYVLAGFYFFPVFVAAGFPAAAFSFLNSAWTLRMSAMNASFVCKLG